MFAKQTNVRGIKDVLEKVLIAWTLPVAKNKAPVLETENQNTTPKASFDTTNLVVNANVMCSPTTINVWSKDAISFTLTMGVDTSIATQAKLV